MKRVGEILHLTFSSSILTWGERERQPPAVDVILDQSPWGLGLMYDRLLLSTEENRYIKQFSVNPCIVLALVEAVLGYDQVSVHAGQWTYRRNVEFR